MFRGSAATGDTRGMRFALGLAVAAALLTGVAAPAHAQDQTPAPAPPPAETPDSQSPPPAPPPADEPASVDKNRIFGLVPNFNTVEGSGPVAPVTASDGFKMAALNSFDPFVYPFYGLVAGVGQLRDSPEAWSQDWKGYGQRYLASFADGAISSSFTTGLMPALLKQDPRYFQGRADGFLPRFGYAASRVAVTRSRSGQPQFNLSEVTGTLATASVSNLYYPQDERTASATMTRWGMQVMWDIVANELKEFWPDIRKRWHRS